MRFDAFVKGPLPTEFDVLPGATSARIDLSDAGGSFVAEITRRK